MPLSRVLHILAFASLLCVWTWALLSPNPVPEQIKSEIDVDWQFVLSKCLHAGAYTFLTVLGGRLTRPGRGRRLFIAFMLLHGVVTEVLQATMDLGRHGCVRDVLIDWTGIGVGVMFLKWFPVEDGERRKITLPSP